MAPRLSTSLLITAILSCVLLFVGCSGGPMVPDGEISSQIDEIRSAVSSHSFMGYHLLAIDTKSGEIDVIPLRSADLHINVVGIMNATMGVTAAGVPSEHDPPNGLFVFDITLEHPFAAKPQLAGFDVKGILITDGDALIDGLQMAGAGDTRLVNADGYTRWWNPSEFTDPGLFGFTEGILAIPGNNFTAQVNPYKLFADRLGRTDSLVLVVDEPLTSDMGRAVFTAGSSNTRRYEIKFKMSPGPQIYYAYAIDAAWAPPSPNPPSAIPDDFPIEANQPEPYRLKLTETLNSLYYDSGTGIGGGTVEFFANVHDWQGQDSGSFPLEFNEVKFYCPELGVDGHFASYIGQDAYKARHRVMFGTLIPESTEPVEFYGSVDSTDGSTYKQTTAAGPEEPLKTWQTITMDVVDPECNTDFNNHMYDALVLDNDQTVIETLCGGSDDVDFYSFEVPFGYFFNGTFGIHCSIPDSYFEITDSEGVLLMTDTVDGWLYTGSADPPLTAGTYYLSIHTNSSSIPGLYTILSYIHNELIVPETPADVTPPNLSLDANWVHVDGDYLYLANHYFVWAFDITDDYTPVLLSRTEVRSTGDPAMFFPYMYLYEYDGIGETTLKMLDLSDPASPILDDFIWRSNTEYEYIHVDSGRLYTSQYGGSFGITTTLYNYQADPNLPEFLGWLDNDDDAVLSMAVMYKGTPKESLIICQPGGLYAYNTYDPGLPDLIDSIGATPPFTSNKFMAVSGEYIVKINYNLAISGYNLNVYRYTNGLSLDFQSGIEYPSGYVPTAFDVYGSWIVVGSYTGVNRLNRVYSFTNPMDIQYDQQFQTRSRCIAIAHDQSTLAVMQEFYAPRLANISGNTTPEFYFERFKGINYPTESLIIGDFMYQLNNKGSAHYRSGIGIEFPPDSTITNMYSMSYDIDCLAGNDRIIAQTRAGDQLFFGRPNDGHWADTGSFNLSQDIASIAVAGDYMYVVLESPSLMQVYNTANFPDSDPSQLPDVSCSPAVQNLMVHGDAMYGFDLDTMFVFNLATPSAPAQGGVYVVGGNINDSLAFGDYLFLAYGSTLGVVDISDPLNPTQVTNLTMPYSQMKYLTRVEQYLIVGDTDHHPVFVDITDPSSPVIYGEPITDDPIWPIRGLNSSENYLYELCDSYGVRMYQLY